MPLDAADPSLRKLVGSLDARLDEIVDKMVASYSEAIPNYRNASPELAVDIREGARSMLLVGAAVVGGGTSAQAIRDPLRELGRRRALQGLTLDDVLNAFMIGTRTFWEEIMKAAPEDPAERAEVLSHVMLATLDLLQNATSTVSAGWREIDDIRIVDEEHDLRTIVEMMAGIRKTDEEHPNRLARRGIDLEGPVWCLVTHEKESGGTLRELRRRYPSAAVAPSGQRLIAFLPGNGHPDSVAGCSCGLARATDTTAAYRRARSAHKVALHLARDSVVYDEVVPLALVLDASIEERKAFVAAQLGPVLEDPLGAELADSLQAFYAAGQSVAAAARDLHVHRHTLEYRLGRLESLLGVDLRSSDSRLLLEFALALRKETS